jgi:putative transposase
MSNHYHLMMGTPDANISRAMRHINGVYTQKINKKHKKEGSLFKGRYKSILIGGNDYFQECIRYIHRNPIKAGLEKNLGMYKWTSHKFYLKKDKRFDWVSVDEGLSYF